MEDHVNRPTKMGARVLITDGGYDYLTRLDFVVLDELDYLPFAQAGGQLLFHPISRLCERTSIIVTTPGLRRMAFRLRRREDDDSAAGPGSPIIARSSRPETSPGTSRTALKAKAEDPNHPHLARPLQSQP